jgi:glycosyltransferase involved in cell wall biosynthesis
VPSSALQKSVAVSWKSPAPPEVPPLISIVVPSFNQGRYIEQTLTSIIGQGWPRLELIVIDGGSTDETAAVVEKHRHAITHFISEPDRGQADAINKGFRLATGEILAWLNSDDMYLPCTLQKVAQQIADSSQPALVTGGVLCMYEGRAEARAYLPYKFDAAAMRTRDRMFQAASFWTRALWQKTGELNESCHYVLDWEWFLRASQHCAFTTIEDFLAIYRFHAAHKSSSGDDRRTREITELVEQHAGPEWGAAYREIAAELPRLNRILPLLRRYKLSALRSWIFHDLYHRHGSRIKTVLAQLNV